MFQTQSSHSTDLVYGMNGWTVSCGMASIFEGNINSFYGHKHKSFSERTKSRLRDFLCCSEDLFRMDKK